MYIESLPTFLSAIVSANSCRLVRLLDTKIHTIKMRPRASTQQAAAITPIQTSGSILIIRDKNNTGGKNATKKIAVFILL